VIRFLTLRDKSFTLHDMQYVVRAAGLRGFGDLVRQLGGRPAALLGTCHLPAEALDDETALIDCRLGILLLERAAQALNCPDFGLRLSARQDVGILGPLAFALRHSQTAGEGLECVSRYFFVHSNAFSLTVRRASAKGKMAELRFDLLAPDVPLARQFWDLCLGTTCRVFRFLTQDAYPIKAAHFPHAPLASVSTYRKQFGETVLFEQAQAALLVDSESLEVPLTECNQMLKEMALNYLDMNFASAPSLSNRIRLAVANALDSPQCRIEAIADLFNLHSRTLQRHLEAEGTSFEVLRDEARRDAARRYLTSTRLPLAQVAGLLGLSEQSALTRACKRWFDATPKSIRAQVQ
jgi:AraC-like DNA-binding protein